MGYFSTGIVFFAQPDFVALPTALPGHSVCGYKHKSAPVWLLDIWQARGRSNRWRTQFGDDSAEGFQIDLSGVDEPTREFLTNFERLRQALGERGPSEAGYVHLTLAVSSAVNRLAFLFAANDEELDLGCQVLPGSLVSFGCNLGQLSVEYHRGELTVTPLRDLEDEDEDGVLKLIGQVQTVPGVVIMPTRDVDGGSLLYEHPVRQWPSDAGDPAQLLGLGTWDVLENVGSDFEVVYEYFPQ